MTPTRKNAIRPQAVPMNAGFSWYGTPMSRDGHSCSRIQRKEAKMTKARWWFAAMALVLAAPLMAQDAAPAQATGQTTVVNGERIRVEPTVVVVGEQPGPGMWIVRKGGHDLYLLGTLTPLPMRMQWQAKQLKAVLAQAQEVIRLRGVSFEVKVGFFKGLFLLPKLLGARKSPDGKELKDLVAPNAYARWLALKARYIGSDRGIERYRPLFAAQELYMQAMKKNDLESRDVVWPVVEKAIEEHHPVVTVVGEPIVITDPKPLLVEWSKTTLDDLACFDNTMHYIETDLDAMRARANAWSTGDIAALRRLPPVARWDACNDAISEAGIGKRLGYGDARRSIDAKWLAAAETALGRNAVTFASLPLDRMLGANGYLAQMQARGYTVIAPDTVEDDAEPAASE